MGSVLLPLLCNIYIHYFEEKLLMCINFFIGLYMWMIFLFLFLPILTFLVCCLWLIQMIIVSYSLPKFQMTIIFFFLMNCSEAHWQVLDDCLQKFFSVSLPFNALSKHPPQQKMAAFYTYVYRALQIAFMLLVSPMNLNT